MPCNSESAVVTPVSPRLRAKALQLLWGRLEIPVRERQIALLEAEAASGGESYWQGLMGCSVGTQLTGVVWVQFHAGNTASLYGPVLVTENRILAQQLIESAIAQANQRGVRIVHALKDLDHSPETHALLQAGFAYATDLQYLFCDVAAIPPPQPDSFLHFDSWSDEQDGRFAQIVERTYINSLDCPRIEGVRSIEEVLAGYRAVGVFDPARWLLVSIADATTGTFVDIGCLLLADQPTSDQFELVYMGVVPEHRGKSWGSEIVRQALWRASIAGRKRIVLAVDSANHPATRMYAAAGFCSFDRRALYLREIHRDG